MRISLPGGAELETDGSITEVVDATGAKVRLHVAKAWSMLIERWRKPAMMALIEVYATESQEIENMFWDLLLAQDPDYANGYWLDLIGARVGQPRNGYPDEAYRAFVRARIAANKSRGRAEDLIAVVEAATGAAFHLDDLQPGFRIVFDEPSNPGVMTALPVLILQAARAVTIAGSVTQLPSSNTLRAGSVYGVASKATGLSSVYGGTPNAGRAAYYSKVS